MAYSEGGTSLGIGRSTELVAEIEVGNLGFAQGPERQLMSALLFDGVQNFMAYATAGTGRVRSRHKEAYLWVLSGNTDYVFSFCYCCEALGIDPDSLRLGLINLANSFAMAASNQKQWKRGRRKG